MPQKLAPLTVKRLVREFKQLQKEKHEYIQIVPDKTDMLLWYFLIKGPEKSDYEGGYYIGKIMHDKDYPTNPPHFNIHTPNGRFTINQRICLTITGYHSDQWSPSWTMSRMIDAFMSIMLDDVDDGISHIKRSSTERQQLARESILYNKNELLQIATRFDRFINKDGDIIPLIVDNLNDLCDQTKTLNLINNKLTDEQCILLCEKLSSKKVSLTSLNLTNSKLTTDQLSKLCNILEKNKTLQILNLTDNEINEEENNILIEMAKVIDTSKGLKKIIGISGIDEYLTQIPSVKKSKKRSKTHKR